jgi:hypothetical protein
MISSSEAYIASLTSERKKLEKSKNHLELSYLKWKKLKKIEFYIEKEIKGS